MPALDTNRLLTDTLTQLDETRELARILAQTLKNYESVSLKTWEKYRLEALAQAEAARIVVIPF